MASSWRLLETYAAEPGFNMGLDEALWLVSGPEPVLRFYTWDPEALSLGYFQRFADVPEAARAPVVVRRLTGGGAIHHARELTFSIAAPLDDPLYHGEVRDSYRRVHEALAEALAELGVRARLRAGERLLSEREGSGMCFQASSPLDLVWDARKGVGSAQRRGAARVLHHGSIKLGPSALDPTVAGLAAGAAPSDPRALAARIARVFARRFGLALEPDEPRAAELEHAHARAAHFLSEAFVHRR